MKVLLFVFLGGGLGSCCRYLLSKWMNPLSAFLPYGTLLSNILACLVLGFAAYLFENRFPQSNSLRLMVLVGFCGGFSTFSTFSNEVFQFIRSGNNTSMITYSLASIILCNMAIGLGIWLASWLSKSLA